MEVEAKSLQLALVKAAGQLGTTQDQLAYRVVADRAGFFGLFGRRVSVEAWRRQGSRSGGRRPAARPALSRVDSSTPRRDLDEAELKELKERLLTFFKGICRQLLDEQDVTVALCQEEDRLILDADSEELAAMMSRNTRLPESMEHLLRKMPRYLKQELPFRIFVDACGRRRGREQDLVGMAQDLSDKVSENKRPVVLNYRSSYDRKIIHMALDQDKRVYTKSIGTGPHRKLIILPVGGSADELATHAQSAGI